MIKIKEDTFAVPVNNASCGAVNGIGGSLPYAEPGVNKKKKKKLLKDVLRRK